MSKLFVSTTVFNRSKTSVLAAAEWFLSIERPDDQIVSHYPHADVVVAGDDRGDLFLMSKAEWECDVVIFAPFTEADSQPS
ncbi:hypothetical protein [Rhizobium tubonense]|uniref:Uncharacterized protein n=1 Tax=Rhizobium tubonense TaxID=484088 RepID=A0A2W4EG02_9HYPH|nr:hypothetical protein [Rhizobium tubonense]PZM10170.1 hypothetical protein CPY51_23715 [Rhizobium tubonense]